jgi:hypothetical protein
MTTVWARILAAVSLLAFVVGIAWWGGVRYLECRVQKELQAATERQIARDIEQAEEWLQSGELLEVGAIEAALVRSMTSEFPCESDKEKIAAALARCRNRRYQLEHEVLLAEAQASIKSNDAASAIVLLSKYIANPDAEQEAKAKSLLTQLRLATSDAEACATLNRLSNAEFSNFLETNALVPGMPQPDHPEILGIWQQTLRANIGVAQNERLAKQQEQAMEIPRKLAEERQRAEEKAAATLAAEEARRRIEEAKRAYQRFREKRDRWLSSEREIERDLRANLDPLLQERQKVESQLAANPVPDRAFWHRNDSTRRQYEFTESVIQSVLKERRAAQTRLSEIAAEMERHCAQFVEKVIQLREDVRMVALQEDAAGSRFAAFWHAYYDYLEVKRRVLTSSTTQNDELVTAKRRCRDQLRILFQRELESQSIDEFFP